MFQCLLTAAAGKRLIARALLTHHQIRRSLESSKLVIIAGTTNGAVAEEVLKSINQEKEFSKKRFFRGVTLPPGMETTEQGRLPDESEFPGDVVIDRGTWDRGKSVYDVVDDLEAGDVIVKGANAFNPDTSKAGILIGHPKGGTISAVIGRVVGKRLPLIIPVGLEKRVHEDIDEIAGILNHPKATGPRMLPVTGDVISEIEAVKILSGADATLVSGGGIGGAEGAVWLAVEGDRCSLETAENVISQVTEEEQFRI